MNQHLSSRDVTNERMKRLKNSRGAAAVEMALMVPLLVLLALGAVDLGRVFYDVVAVTSAARAGLSYGSLNAAKSQDTTKISEVANADAHNTQGGISFVIGRVCQCDDTTVVDCETGTCSEGASRVYVRVRASKTFETALPYPGIPSSVNITRDAYMRAR